MSQSREHNRQFGKRMELPALTRGGTVWKALDALLQELHLFNASRLEYSDMGEVPLLRYASGCAVFAHTSNCVIRWGQPYPMGDQPAEFNEWQPFVAAGLVEYKIETSAVGLGDKNGPTELKCETVRRLEMTPKGAEYLVQAVKSEQFGWVSGRCLGDLKLKLSRNLS